MNILIIALQGYMICWYRSSIPITSIVTLKKTTVVGGDVAVNVFYCVVKYALRGFKSKVSDIKLSTCSCFDVQLQLIYLVLRSATLFFLPHSSCFVYRLV